MRVPDAGRERAIDVLKAAFAEGRLTREAHAERVGRAYGSRVYAELAAVSGDLPAWPLRGAAFPARPGGPTRWPSPPVSAHNRASSRSTANDIRYFYQLEWGHCDICTTAGNKEYLEMGDHNGGHQEEVMCGVIPAITRRHRRWIGIRTPEPPNCQGRTDTGASVV